MRLQPDDRRARILAAAVDLAAADGYSALTRDGVAKAADVSPGLVIRYFYAMKLLRQAVMQVAVDRELHRILAAGLVEGCPVAHAAPLELKMTALKSIVA